MVLLWGTMPPLFVIVTLSWKILSKGGGEVGRMPVLHDIWVYIV